MILPAIYLSYFFYAVSVYTISEEREHSCEDIKHDRMYKLPSRKKTAKLLVVKASVKLAYCIYQIFYFTIIQDAS